MPPPPAIRTRVFILQLIPSSDTSRILAGLTPDHGIVRLKLPGIRTVSRRRYSQADLFQMAELEFRPASAEDGLAKGLRFEPLRNYPGLSRHPRCLEAAAWAARLLLLNLHGGLLHPQLFTAVETAWARLEDPALAPELAAIASRCGILAALLNEEGSLPAYAEDPAAATRRDLILRAANGPLPPLSAKDWERTRDWLETIARHAELRLPS